MHQKIENAITQCVEERKLFGAGVAATRAGLTLRITTRLSRDPARSNNGGEYEFWTNVWIKGDQTLARGRCSCDFWQPEEEPTVVGDASEFALILAEVANRGVLRDATERAAAGMQREA